MMRKYFVLVHNAAFVAWKNTVGLLKAKDRPNTIHPSPIFPGFAPVILLCSTMQVRMRSADENGSRVPHKKMI